MGVEAELAASEHARPGTKGGETPVETTLTVLLPRVSWAAAALYLGVRQEPLYRRQGVLAR